VVASSKLCRRAVPTICRRSKATFTVSTAMKTKINRLHRTVAEKISQGRLMLLRTMLVPSEKFVQLYIREGNTQTTLWWPSGGTKRLRDFTRNSKWINCSSSAIWRFATRALKFLPAPASSLPCCLRKNVNARLIEITTACSAPWSKPRRSRSGTPPS
jgi:hypothetical protein